MVNPRTICFTSTFPATAFRSVETPTAEPATANTAPTTVRKPLPRLTEELLLITMFLLHRVIMEQGHSHSHSTALTRLVRNMTSSYDRPFAWDLVEVTDVFA